MIKRRILLWIFPKAVNIIDAFRIVGSPAAFEYKYDGFRVMINKENGGKIKIFTRRLEDVTMQFPEIVDYVRTHIKGENFIIDAEAVGFDSRTKEYTDFQHISRRIRRKYGINEMRKKLPIELVVFDIIYHNGKNLINESFENRRKIIEKIVHEEKFKIILALQILIWLLQVLNGELERGLGGLLLLIFLARMKMKTYLELGRSLLD
jgi:DNA ligase-1